jgi:NADH dehydrogenase
MILVTGAAGLIGRHLVAGLIAARQPVRVLLPPDFSKARINKLPWHESVEIVIGTLYDADALHQALIDVNTVYHLASAQWWGRRRDLERVDLVGTRSLIAAARAARIGRIIVMSQLGASPSSAFTLLRAKGQFEDLIRTSGLAYTIIRSGIIFAPDDHFVNGIAALLHSNPVIVMQPGQGENLLHPLYIDDLVEALIRTLENVDTVDQIIEIGGPEYLSYNELLLTVMRVTHTPRSIVSLPPYLLRTLTRTTRTLFPGWPVTLQWYDILATNRTAPLGTIDTMFGIHPARFEDTIVLYMPRRRYALELGRALLRRRSGRV